MAVNNIGEKKIWQRYEQKKQFLHWLGWFICFTIFVYCFQLISEKTFWMFVWDSPNQVGDLAYRMIPPKWDPQVDQSPRITLPSNTIVPFLQPLNRLMKKGLCGQDRMTVLSMFAMVKKQNG